MHRRRQGASIGSCAASSVISTALRVRMQGKTVKQCQHGGVCRRRARGRGRRLASFTAAAAVSLSLKCCALSRFRSASSLPPLPPLASYTDSSRPVAGLDIGNRIYTTSTHSLASQPSSPSFHHSSVLPVFTALTLHKLSITSAVALGALLVHSISFQ